MNKAIVGGVSMTPFSKPSAGRLYYDMAAEAVRGALKDAGLSYSDVQQVFAGYVYGDSTSGQRAVYDVGLSGVPIINVNNNCSTGSTALFLARQLVASEAADCVLALGFEQMAPGALAEQFTDRPSAFERFNQRTDELAGHGEIPLAIRYFGGAGQAHMEKYGTPLETFAAIRAKASRHGKRNPFSVFKDELSVQDVLDDKVIWPGVMTRTMACPPTCGAAAAIIVSEKFARERGLDAGVAIVAQSMVTDGPSTFESDMIRLVGSDMAKSASGEVYEAAGIGIEDIDVIELHDCFAHNELIVYEAIGLCPEGEGAAFVADGENTYGGRYVTNPSGGLLSKGHPLGATGLAQCFELTHQLRGVAGERQVEGARTALQHNFGLGGACVVTLYQRQ